MGEMELTQDDIDQLLARIDGDEQNEAPAPAQEDAAPEAPRQEPAPAGPEAPRVQDDDEAEESVLREPAFERFGPTASSEAPTAALQTLLDIPLDVSLELGRTSMRVEEILRLGEGAVVELDKLAGDPVDILVNEEPVARGEIVVLNDNFCVRVTEILAPDERLESLRQK